MVKPSFIHCRAEVTHYEQFQYNCRRFRPWGFVPGSLGRSPLLLGTCNLRVLRPFRFCDLPFSVFVGEIIASRLCIGTPCGTLIRMFASFPLTLLFTVIWMRRKLLACHIRVEINIYFSNRLRVCTFCWS